MSRSTKQSWLEGPGDLREDTVEDVPVKGQSVLVRGLPAAFSNQAQSEALKMITGARGEQTATVDTARMSILQFAHGCVEPEFSVAEAEKIAEKFGPAFHRVVAKIDELSGVDKEAIEEANARFQPGSGSEGGEDVDDGTGSGDSGPDLPARTGA